MAIIIGTDPQVVIASNDKPVFVHTGGAQGTQGYYEALRVTRAIKGILEILGILLV